MSPNEERARRATATAIPLIQRVFPFPLRTTFYDDGSVDIWWSTGHVFLFSNRFASIHSYRNNSSTQLHRKDGLISRRLLRALRAVKSASDL